MDPAGSIPSFIVLDREVLEDENLSLEEKVILAYLYAAEECEPAAREIDFVARYLDVSESTVRRAVKHIISLGLLDEECS